MSLFMKGLLPLTHLDNRIQTLRVQLPVRQSDEWSGAVMAQAGAIDAFH